MWPPRLSGKVMDVFSGERKENFLNGLNLGKESSVEGDFWVPAEMPEGV